MCVFLYYFFFFFSSRRRHTRFKCDWSSDVCSSDLYPIETVMGQAGHHRLYGIGDALLGLQRRVAAGLGVDLHLDIGDVGHGVDGQALVVVDAKARHGQHGQQDQPALLYGESDDAFKHGLSDQWLCSALALPSSALSMKLPSAT